MTQDNLETGKGGSLFQANYKYGVYMQECLDSLSARWDSEGNG